MIVNKKTGYLFDKPEHISVAPKPVVKKLEFNKINSDYIFVIPNEIKDDHSKLIYKVGFLWRFYKLLFPDISYFKIHKEINSGWQVFKSKRQMERLSKKYIELFEKKEEH